MSALARDLIYELPSRRATKYSFASSCNRVAGESRRPGRGPETGFQTRRTNSHVHEEGKGSLDFYGSTVVVVGVIV